MKPYFAFQWHITDNCDQRCEHCYIFADKHIVLREMSWTEIQAVFQNCLKMCEGLGRTPYFYITGGDPILHKNFWKLLELLKNNAIDFGILGNPFHLSDEVCGRLKNYGCDKYQLSLDGMRETHDRIRKRGSFDTTLDAIHYIREAGIKCAVMATVSKTNADEMPEIIDTVVKHKADIFAFGRYCPTSFENDTCLTPKEYKNVLETCWQKFEEYRNSDTTFNLKDHLWTLFLYEKGLFTIPDNLAAEVMYDGCNCGNSHLTILPDGAVYACRRMKSEIGNALTDDLQTLFLGDRMETYRNYTQFEKCSKCELLRFCRGCPAVTYGYTGNFYGPDPQCWKQIA
jgi:radical SAM/SPASM domain protein of ACGX system